MFSVLCLEKQRRASTDSPRKGKLFGAQVIATLSGMSQAFTLSPQKRTLSPQVLSHLYRCDYMCWASERLVQLFGCRLDRQTTVSQLQGHNETRQYVFNPLLPAFPLMTLSQSSSLIEMNTP